MTHVRAVEGPRNVGHVFIEIRRKPDAHRPVLTHSCLGLFDVPFGLDCNACPLKLAQKWCVPFPCSSKSRYCGAGSPRQMPGRVEVALLLILLRDHLRLFRPGYREAGVVPAHTALELRGIERRYEVERLGILFERQKAAGKAARGAYIMRRFSALSSAPKLCPKVADPGRRSRIASHSVPRTQRTTLTSPASPS